MVKKIFYWTPYIGNVGTVKSTLQSSIAMKKKLENKIEVVVINTCGEWEKYIKNFHSKGVNIINLNTFRFFRFFPPSGYLSSRIYYIFVFFFSFFPLIKLLKKNPPDYFIAHLVTSLPLLIFRLFSIKSKLILRISGLPRLNFFRYYFWKICSSRIHKVTCPSLELLDELKNKKLFDEKKLFFLQDAVLSVNLILKLKKAHSKIHIPTKKDFFLSIGRLTKQKNFEYLINEFKKISDKCNFDIIILGDGDEKQKIINLIKKNKLDKRIFLLGYVKNVFSLLSKCEAFILTSLWEDPGFVLVESAYANTIRISSNCGNGPKELLYNGQAGYLFESNEVGALSNCILKYINDKKNFIEIQKKKILAKKISRKYSNFNHAKTFEKILEL
jgi:glycosyltransferase involved in cell wall biosynthesis